LSCVYLIGTSGWHYDHWKGRFYPAKLPKSRWLDYYARYFPTVEINYSFYRLPAEKAFQDWRATAPEGFTFAVKVSRYITHMKKLRDVEQALDNFYSRARLLGDKLGPLLYQLPPNLPRNDALLEGFLANLPKSMRQVFEFRHPSWLAEGVLELLRRYGAGFCVMDMPGLACPLVATADYAYVRFHGSQAVYSSCYTDEELAGWAARIKELGRGLGAIYVYFNNDAQAFAVQNAITLMDELK